MINASYRLHAGLKRAAGILGALSAIALVILSWLPATMEARTGLLGQLEHVIAYAGAAGFAAIAVPASLYPPLAVCFIALAGVLEVGQLYVPGRTSQFIDFAASSAGALIGLFVGAYILCLTERIIKAEPRSS